MIKRILTSVLLVLMAFSALMAQESVVITGIVLSVDDEPLPGATVSVLGTKDATATDFDGKFTLKVPAGSKDGKIQVTYIGMRPVEMAISKITGPLTIRLAEDETRLEEVIVTGYTTLSKERATGAFGSLSAKKLETKLATNLTDRIEGQMAGVVVNKDGTMSIRGRSTLKAETDPLVVVDGYPTELKLSDLNPDNIANITVLKDAVAASIYGSRSANGVIIVTSKQGQEGKMRVSYRGTIKLLPKPDLDYLHMADASEYIDAELDLYNQNPAGTTIAKRGTMSDVSKLIAFHKAGMISDSEYNSSINALRQNDFLSDMKKYMFRTELTHTHNIGINGGTETNRYNLAVNYTNTKGSFINTHSNRLLIDLNNEWKPFKFLTVGIGASISYSRSHAPNADWQTYANYSSAYPYSRLYDDSGNLNDMTPLSYASQQLYAGVAGAKSVFYNPIQESYESYNKTVNFGARINGFVRWNIIDNLNLEVGGNWNRSNSTYRAIYGVDSYIMRNAYNSSTSLSNPTNHYIPDGDAIDETRYTREDWTLRTQISYSKSFGPHRVSALAGNEVRRITFDNTQVETRFGYNQVAGSFTPVNMKDLKSGAYNSDMLGGGTGIYFPVYGSYSLRDNRFVSWYFNGSYEYDNRYLVSGSIREDLTNFFGTDPKYRHKPMWSVGATWKIANEAFFGAEWVDRLNLRASYGVNGNISLSEGPYLILKAGSFNPTTGGVANTIASYPNSSLRWENTKTINVGVDFDVFDNRLGVSFDYYYKKSTDILASDSTDPTTGTSRMTKNLGVIDNRGVEISLHGTPIRVNDFSWDLIFNMSLNNNKVREYNVTRNYPTLWAWNEPVHAAGYPMFGLFGYKFAGLDNQGITTIYGADGKVKYASNANVDDIVYLGTSVPKTELSLTNTFRYKNWDLSFMFIAKLGHKYRKDVFQGSNINSRYVGDRWKKPGDEAHTIYPALQAWSMDMFYFPFCDVNIGNANYAKLRDVTLSYTFDKALLSRIGMSEARIYLQGRNLLCITGKGVDIDPETMEVDYTGMLGASTNTGYSVLPRSAEYYIGLSFSF